MSTKSVLQWLCLTGIFLYLSGPEQLKAQNNIRDSRISVLRKIGSNVADTIVRGQATGLIRLCGAFDVSVGEDQYLSCSELKNALEDRSSFLYCQLFETSCYRRNLEAFAFNPTNDARDLLERAKAVLSTQDVLARSGVKLKIEVSFDRTRGSEDLDRATIVFKTTDPPDFYGEMIYPQISVVYVKGSWVLSSLFPAL